MVAAVVLAVAMAAGLRPKAAASRDAAEAARRDMLEKKSVLESRETEALEQDMRIEALAALKADIDRLSGQENEALRLRDEAQREMDAAEAAAQAAINAGAARMTAADEAAIRDAIEREQAAQARISHRLEAAQDDFSDARARYAATQDKSEASSPKRPVLPAIAVIALAIAGAAWVLAGSRMGSMAACIVG